MQVCANAVGLGWVVSRGCLPSQRAWLAVCDMRSGRAPAVAYVRREGTVLARALYIRRVRMITEHGPARQGHFCVPLWLLNFASASAFCERCNLSCNEVCVLLSGPKGAMKGVLQTISQTWSSWIASWIAFGVGQSSSASAMCNCGDQLFIQACAVLHVQEMQCTKVLTAGEWLMVL